MNIKVDDIRDELTVHDKDNLIHAKGNEVLNIDINDNKYDNTFEKAIKLIANIKNLTEDEYKIYRWFIHDSIHKGYEMKDSTIIEMNRDVVNTLCRLCLVSKSTVYRIIENLILKGIITNFKDDKCIPVTGKYLFVDNFNISKYRHNQLKIITITL